MQASFLIEQAKQLLQEEGYLYLKYVRVGDTFRFADATSFYQPNHVDMIAEGEEAVSASYLKVTKGMLQTDGWSTTLRIGPAGDDEELLRKLFGV